MRELDSVRLFLKYKREKAVADLIDQNTAFLFSEADINQRIYHFREDISEVPLCPYCGTSRKFVKTVHYRETCGAKDCMSKLRSVRIKNSRSTPESIAKVKSIMDIRSADFYDIRSKMFIKKTEACTTEELRKMDIAGLSKAYHGSKVISDIIDGEFGHILNVPQKVHHFKSAVKDVPLCRCGESLAYKNGGHYKRSCGRRECVNMVRSDTCMSLYGTTNIAGSKFYADTIISKTIDKYRDIVSPDLLIGKSVDPYFFVCECTSCGSRYEASQHLIRQRRQLYNVKLCTVCNPVGAMTDTAGCVELVEFIKSIYAGRIIIRDRKVISPLELDVYLPDLNIAMEYNGLYWHSDLHKNAGYHLNKTERCFINGVRLVHIWSDEWECKREIVKSVLSGIIGVMIMKIGARECAVAEVSSRHSKIFMEENHLQGDVRARHRLGLWYGDILVSMMTFGSPRKGIGNNSNFEYEMYRFCNKNGYSVSGGASRLFAAFLRLTQATSVVTYSDRSKYDGAIYGRLGFRYAGNSVPDYYYVVNNVRRNRLSYQKHKLIKQGFDSSKSERVIMAGRGIPRIYDCGSSRWEWTRPF